MLITRFTLENDYFSKEKLLKYYDQIINHICPYIDYYKHCVLKSKNKNLDLLEFKTLSNEFRKQIENFKEDQEGEISEELQGQLKQDSIFLSSAETIHTDLDEDNSLDFSDSILVVDNFIYITFCDPKLFTGDFESGGYFEMGSDEAVEFKGAIEDGVGIEVLDALGEYCCDNVILGASLS